MSKIGIVICNFNKKDYLENCIKSILGQTMDDFTVYVSDNASTDGSASMVQDKFAGKVNLLISEENLGGSGGFNAGMREAMRHGHEYIMLVDNDIVMDKNNVRTLFQCLQEHPEIGITGSKILKMDFPDVIQDYGAMIDFEHLGVRPYFFNEKDRSDLPDIQYCDYVAACSLMVRTEVIDKIGLMPEENFIYWDDMEWGWKCNLAGFKVAACRDATVWHKGGVNVSANTFQTYYAYRNKSLFFAKYMPEEKKKEFKKRLLLEYFRAIYACYYAGKKNRAKTLMNAFDDAIHNAGGKAESYKIREADVIRDRLEAMLENKSELYILSGSNGDILRKIISRIETIKKAENSQIMIHLVADKINELEDNFPEEYEIIKNLPEKVPSDALIFQACEHIFSVKESVYSIPFVDEWCNVICSEKDLDFCKNFDDNFALFCTCYEDILDDWIERNSIYR